MSEKLSEAIIDFANALESACVQLKRYIGEAKGVKKVKEENFSVLNWKTAEGNRIGTFEVANKADNAADRFRRAHSILAKAGATIGNRYHGEGYTHTYWLYGQERIYRQALKS